MAERTECGQSVSRKRARYRENGAPFFPSPPPGEARPVVRLPRTYKRTGFHLLRGIPKVRDGVPHLVLWLELFQGTQGPELARASPGHTAGAQGGRQGLGECKIPITERGVGRLMKKAVKVTRWKLPWAGKPREHDGPVPPRGLHHSLPRASG